MAARDARRALAAAAIATATIGASGLALGEGKPEAKTASRAPAPRRATTTAVPASRGWHAATPGKAAPVDASGRALLVLQGLNIPDHVELTPRDERGGFSAEDLDRAAHVMREPSSGNEHPVDPRLLDAIYRLEAHFHAHEIRIISGYRTPRGGATSNHGKGRAMDLVVPGASDEEVAKFAREQGFAGVGIYPVSGFVHVDVRERSYFWVDTSGPGKRSRIRGILADLAQKSDAAAATRGERGVGPFHVGTSVDTAVGAMALASPSSAPVEEDEGDAVSP
jgi:uncharacterized protein YcbK (DUF882 family)